MAQDAGTGQPVPAPGTASSTLAILPPELLSIIAADPSLTNRDRKQARLTCRLLETAMTPFIFRRAFISRITADRDGFLSLAASPRLAAYVEEVVWYELGCDSSAFANLPDGLDEYQHLQSHLLGASGLFWLCVPPAFPEATYFDEEDPSGISLYQPNISIDFLGQFTAAITCMPKLHAFSSEPMPWDRILSQGADGYPFDVGLMQTHAPANTRAWSQGLLGFLMPTMMEEQGRITRLRCFVVDLSCSFVYAVLASRAALTHITSLDLSFVPGWAGATCYDLKMPVLRRALMEASGLEELSIAMDCGGGLFGPSQPFHVSNGLFQDDGGKLSKWEHLRTLRLAFMYMNERWLVPLVKNHAEKLRHLILEQCDLMKPLDLELSRLNELQHLSITTTEPENPRYHSESDSDEEDLEVLHYKTVDIGEAEDITMGHFVWRNGRRDKDNDDDDSSFVDEADQISDHDSEWWSDAHSDSGD
ncbi:hypothetical protein N8I77_003081 [Diaporthe amygdali]|uniref:F-box domain-containing protein n=1 Tax=Phomopsis amygdali TaxID=1214568 RepID=A0AAD9SH95_PHOAM|nr:hypothetical protein N8I77_003081 [Diaporthe amygdali]